MNHFNRNKQYRVGMINDLLKCHDRKLEYFHESQILSPPVTNWFKLYGAFAKRPSQWTVIYVAEALCKFDLLMEESSSLEARVQEELPLAVQCAIIFMDKLKLASEITKNVPPRTTHGKVGKQKAGLRLQDSIVMHSLSDKSFENDHCASAHCKHRFLLPIGMTPQKIN